VTDQACVTGTCHDENDAVDKPEIGDAAIAGGPDGAAAPDGSSDAPSSAEGSSDAVSSADGSSDAGSSDAVSSDAISSDATSSADGSFVPNPADGPLGFIPSNFTPTRVDGGATGDAGIWTGAVDLDVSSACSGTASSCLSGAGGPVTIAMNDPGSTPADLYVLRSLTIDQTAILGPLTGPRPIILLVLTTVEIHGQLLVSSATNSVGAGGFAGSTGPGAGGTATNASGGGGSYCGVGGTGSSYQGPVAMAGMPYGNATLNPLMGGSGGFLYVAGSGGGGAIQIVAGQSITIEQFGAINAGGAGGVAYGGGGSGGAILLEAPTIAIRGTLAANGGGGGSNSGGNGSNGLPSGQAAAGGGSGDDSGVGFGGMGSAGAALSGSNGANGTGINTAGGGGGAGRIRINSAGGVATTPGVLSPALGTGCATQGVLEQ
jgi:hypothetical protein